MLQNIRDKAGSIFVKILLGGIILSFSITGVIDIINSRKNKRTVATIGGEEIDALELEYRVKESIKRIQNQINQPITNDFIKELDIPRKILNDIISKKAIDIYSEKMNFVITKNSLKRVIESISELRDKKTGKFRPDLFKNFLQNSGTSAKMFNENITKSMIKSQIFSSASFESFDNYYNLIFKGLYQVRDFKILFIPTSKVTLNKKVTKNDIENFYNNNKILFKKPETRNISYILVDYSQVKKNTFIAKELIKERYEEIKESLTEPESRSGTFIIAKTLDEAIKASKKIESGTPLIFVEKELKLSKKSFKNVQKDDFDKNLSDSIFSISLGQASLPVETDDGFVISIVDKINPMEVPTLESSSKDIENELREEIAKNKIYDLREKAENLLNSSQDLDEISKELNFDVKKMNEISYFGKIENKKTTENIKQIALESFKNKKNTISPLVDLTDSSFFIVYVDQINPESIKKIEEVKEEVEKMYTREKKEDILSEEIDKLIEENKSISELEKKYSLKSRKKSLNIIDADKDKMLASLIGQESIEKIFKTPIGKTSYSRARNGYVVFSTEKKQRFTELDRTKERKEFVESMNQMIENDLQSLMTNAIKDEIGSDINEKMMSEISSNIL